MWIKSQLLMECRWDTLFFLNFRWMKNVHPCNFRFYHQFGVRKKHFLLFGWGRKEKTTMNAFSFCFGFVLKQLCFCNQELIGLQKINYVFILVANKKHLLHFVFLYGNIFFLFVIDTPQIYFTLYFPHFSLYQQFAGIF